MSVKSSWFRAAALACLGTASLVWPGAAVAAEDPQGVVSAESTGGQGTVTASCPVGKRVVGGGYEVTAERYDAFGNVITDITGNAPTADGTGWTISVRHGRVRAHARCATTSTGDPRVVVSEKSPGRQKHSWSVRYEFWVPGSGTVTASCPAGTRVVGGGYQETEVETNGFGHVITKIIANAPAVDGTGWTVRVSKGQVRAYALCATPPG